VAGRRDAKRDILPIDLAGADLTRAVLAGAVLTGVSWPKEYKSRQAGWQTAIQVA